LSLFPRHARCQCNGHACSEAVTEMTVVILISSKHHYTAGLMWSLAGHYSTTKVAACVIPPAVNATQRGCSDADWAVSPLIRSH